ncbi:hypothetical protein K040078D81_54700 [Blautia hominis]|uniref:Uncharacterized protein n=1 Tax=Blautia hominis TaxID=2025493 RepID=A0ABQ0BJ45_9FIRM
MNQLTIASHNHKKQLCIASRTQIESPATKAGCFFCRSSTYRKNKTGACGVKIYVGDLPLEIQNGEDGQTVKHTLRAIPKLC